MSKKNEKESSKRPATKPRNEELLRSQQERRKEAKARRRSNKGKGKEEEKGYPLGGGPKAWMQMVIDPGNSPTVLSPAGTSVMCSKAKFVFSEEVAYADTVGGYFTVVARPSPIYPLIISSAPARAPAAGIMETKGHTIHGKFGPATADVGFPYEATLKVNEVVSKKVSAIPLTPITDAANVTHLGFNITTTAATRLSVTLVNHSLDDQYMKIIGIQNGAGNWVDLMPFKLVPGNKSEVFFDANSAAAWTAFSYVICTNGGIPKNPDRETNLGFSIAYWGFVPAGLLSASRLQFVRQDLIDAVNVTNVRITAASILCTNLASVTKEGGELVTANTRQSLIFSCSSTSDLMDKLKSLPENNRIKTGRVADGGYTYYVPDDFDSYSHKPYADHTADDNALCFAGRLDEGGLVRIQSVFVVEFYTPSPLFERNFTPTWSTQYRTLHELLQCLRMASGNEDHESMISNITNRISRVWKFMVKHKDEIEMGSSILLSLAAAF